MDNPYTRMRSYIQTRKQRKAEARKKELFVNNLMERINQTETALRETMKLSYGIEQNAWIRPYRHKYTRLMQFLFRKDKMEIVKYHTWLLVRNGIEEARLICESFHDKRIIVLARNIRKRIKANTKDAYREFKPHEMDVFLQLLNRKIRQGYRSVAVKQSKRSKTIQEYDKLLLHRGNSIYSYLEYVEMKRKILLHEFVEHEFKRKEFLLNYTFEELRTVDTYLAVLYGYVLLLDTRYRRRREGKLN